MNARSMLKNACQFTAHSSKRLARGMMASNGSKSPLIGTIRHNPPTASFMGSVRWHGGPTASADAPKVSVTFLQPDGSSRVVDALVGESLLQTAHRHEVELEGACEGVCACSTCHLILPMDMYNDLAEPSEDEEDMLDMAFGLEETSRLGCQIKVTEDMDGVELKMPAATRNFYVDGHVPKPH
eukprot:CAMPEP_0168793254 /NCGR_PEP_ID=MMETSP0725-20121227/14988_1 /TAXON_ID=265536 /ORGANISM="Amphiprora sp., Strain CCMP467" /LENGTH=182 /DNA_ID=CAMNT_0008844019 /DNA_START=76 /DNA_END=624 /DNA_ORIENTATION=-